MVFHFRRLRWILLFPIPLLWCVVARYGGLEFVEAKLVDLRFHYRGPLPPAAKIVYVDVDSQAIANIGSFPWNRKYFAEVAQVLLQRGGVKAIGMDFVFSDEGMPEAVDQSRLVDGNVQFGRVLWKNPNVIVGAFFGSADFRDPLDKEKLKRRFPPLIANGLPPIASIEPPELPLFNVGRSAPFVPPGVGVIDTIDAGTRWVALYSPTSLGNYYNMGLQLARVYYGVGREGIKIGDNTIELVRPSGEIVNRIPLSRRQLLEVNWFSGWNGYAAPKHVSFEVIRALAEMDQGNPTPAEKKTVLDSFRAMDLTDAIILIGPTDKLLQDLAITPMDDQAVPRVSVHANTVETILSKTYLVRPPTWVGDLLCVVLTAIVTTLAVTGGARSVMAKAVAVVALLGYTACGFFLFNSQHLILPLALPLVSAFSTSFAALIWQVVEEQKQKGRIKGMFATYLSPAVVGRMIDSGKEPELGGHDAEITAYFSDIQGFSSFSEVMSSMKLGELLNEFLTACTDIVQGEGGTLDKYIGDAVVAMFGAPIDAPDHAYRACITSQLIQARVAQLRDKWTGEGEKWPTLVHELRTRIGLNTGVCMIGNFGSNTRFSYTMMGDNVNTAARMESGAKSWGVYTMVTDATRQACEKFGDRVVFRPLGKIVVQGRSQPVPIHEIVGLKESLPAGAAECIARFAEGLERFYLQDWDGAEAIFRECSLIEVNRPKVQVGVKTNPSLVYLKIIEEFRAAPPGPDWDGSYKMKEK